MTRVERLTIAVMLVAIACCLAITGNAIFGWRLL
jgi:hypothetical protein